MKYIKTYENLNKPKFNIGDYVCLETTEDAWRVHTVVKIIDINNKEKIDYHVESFYTHTLSGDIQFWVDECEIERLATPEEIQQYKLLMVIKDYNI